MFCVMSATTPPAENSAEPAERLLGHRYGAVTVGTVALVTFLAFEALGVATAMPAVAEALGGLKLYALAFGAPLAAAIVGMVLSGSWNDTLGPARPLMIGAVLYVAGVVTAGLAHSMGMVAVGRGVQGLGSGLMIVALYVLVARVYPEHLRPKIFAAFSAAWVLPALVGPTISGLIVEHLGWRWVFLAVAALVPPAMLLVWPGLRRIPLEFRDHADGRLLTRRLAWAIGAGVAASLLHMAAHAPALTMTVLLVLGTVGVVITAPRLLPRGTFTAHHGLPTVIALRGLAGAAFLGAEVFIPLLLVRERGLSPTLAGVVLTVGALTWSVGSWLQGHGVMPDRRLRLRAGMTLLAAGIVSTALLVASVVPVAVGIAAWALSGLGMGLVYPTLSVLVLELSAPSDQGRNSSSLQIADTLFTTLTLAVTGTAFAALLAYSTTWPFLAGFAISGLIAALGIVIAGRALPQTGISSMRAAR